jgi:NAD(P)-dependent dehydrogenase (short-subunit alcohol dehydrogenase family)
MEATMSQQVALVTGTSSGIGLAAAVAAAQAGFTTVATLREPSRDRWLREAAEAAGVALDIRALDVTDEAGAAAGVARVVSDYGRLDALVNNAGVGHIGTIELDPVAEYRRIMEVNYFGVVHLTKAAMPHLRAAGGRLITVTSVGGVVGQPFNEAYCAAKFAVKGMMESLAPVAARVGVSVCIVEPGAVSTRFVANVGADPAALIAGAGPYAPALQGYLERTVAQFASAAAQTSDDVAAVIVAALTEENPVFRRQTSPAAAQFTGLKLADQDGTRVTGLTSAWLG